MAEPVNLRWAKCCGTCSHSDQYEEDWVECLLYGADVYNDRVCDSWDGGE